MAEWDVPGYTELKALGSGGFGDVVLASELRCHPEHCTAMVKAVLALHYLEHDPFAVVRAA